MRHCDYQYYVSRKAILAWIPVALFSISMVCFFQMTDTLIFHPQMNWTWDQWNNGSLWWALINMPCLFAVIMTSDTQGHAVPEWKHMLRKDLEYTLEKVDQEDRDDVKAAKGKKYEVFVRLGNLFVATGMYVDRMEEFVQKKVDYKYDKVVVRV